MQSEQAAAESQPGPAIIRSRLRVPPLPDARVARPRVEGLLARLVDLHPYREAAWRLAMRVPSALGDDDGVIRTFQRCERALAVIGAKPTSTTLRLLESLRR